MSKKPSKNVAAPAPALPIPTDTHHTTIKSSGIPLAEIVIPESKADRLRDAAFDAEVRGLAVSIGTLGLQQPIIVRADPAVTSSKFRYELVAGERRLLAMRLLNWDMVPAVVLPWEADAAEIRAAENLQRLDLDDDQKALVIGDMVASTEARLAAEQGVASADDLHKLPAPARDAVRKAAVQRVAERFGKPLQWVRDYAYVGGLPKRVRELGAAGRLSLSHLKALAAVVDADTCIDLAIDSAAGEDPAREPMGSLDELRHRVNATLNSLAKVPWDLTIAFAGKIACQGCGDNSRNRTGLFEGRGKEVGARGDRGCMTDINFAADAESAGVCLNMPCFKAKADACKTAMRNAGNRIAGAAAEAKPKERGAVVGRLVNEANQKHNFVKPTVFRKEVQERIESKMEKPKGGKPAAGQSRQSWNGLTPEQQAKQDAEHKLNDAVRVRNAKLLDAWQRYAEKLPMADQALILLAFETIPATGAQDGRSPKALKHTQVLISLVEAALDQGSITGFDTIIKHLPTKIAGRVVDWRTAGNVSLVDFLARKAGVAEIPPVPKLEDFLPKKPAAEKSKKSPPDHSPGAGKKPAGKKKARKAAPSPLAAAPLPSTISSVMDDTDDRGRSERARASKGVKPAAAAGDGEED